MTLTDEDIVALARTIGVRPEILRRAQETTESLTSKPVSDVKIPAHKAGSKKPTMLQR